MMKNNLPIIGMEDIYGLKLEKADYVLRIMADCVKRYNYSQLEVPILEHSDSFAEHVVGKSPWPEWNKNGCFYLNIDNYETSYDSKKSQTEALLIPEGTVSVTRWLGRYIDESVNPVFPIKVFYSLTCFRNELIDTLSTTKKRQFKQFGVEILGTSQLISDVENIYMITNILKKLHVNSEYIRIRFNNIQIFNQLALESKFSENDQILVKEILDTLAECKAGKKTERAPEATSRITELLDSYELSHELRACWFCIMNHKSGHVSTEEYSIFPEVYHQWFKELNQVNTALKAHNINALVDLCVIRSHEYYTGFSFEVDVIAPNYKFIEIAGGGRYDKLVGKFVQKSLQVVPSTGFAFGIERVISMMETIGLFPEADEVKSTFTFSNNKRGTLIEIPPTDNPALAYLDKLSHYSMDDKQGLIDIYLGDVSDVAGRQQYATHYNLINEAITVE